MRPRHLFYVQNRKIIEGSAGQDEFENVGQPIKVRGTAHPLDETEIQLYGDTGIETRKVFAPSWPGSIYSVITFDGGTWDQQWPAESHSIGQRTKHHEVVIRRRTGYQV